MTEEYIEHYRKMLLIRRFEEKVNWLFTRDLLPGTSHLCIGQEAVAVGAVSALTKDDYVISTHRGHGHFLAKGAELNKLYAELMGKNSGYCRGKGGTQHLCATDINFLGTNGITGGGIPIATGVGLSIKLSRSDKVVMSFFGDGASNQGTFHESINMASVWKLPVIYVCENNLYAMSVSIKDSMNIENVADRSIAYGIPGIVVDGMDILKVKEAVEEAVKRARNKEGPTIIEAKTYRYCGHSKSDLLKYRTREEEDKWLNRDPINKFRDFLTKQGVPEDELNNISDTINKDIEEAIEYAINDDPPPNQEAFEGVFNTDER